MTGRNCLNDKHVRLAWTRVRSARGVLGKSSGHRWDETRQWIVMWRFLMKPLASPSDYAMHFYSHVNQMVLCSRYSASHKTRRRAVHLHVKCPTLITSREHPASQIEITSPPSLRFNSHPLCLWLTLIRGSVAVSVLERPFTAALFFSSFLFDSAIPLISIAIR